MRRSLTVVALLAAACGSVDDRDECSASSDCPAGQRCARTADGDVCWPDAVAPEVADVSAGCEGGCRRDSVLRVTATASDDTGEVLDVSVALDLGGPEVPMTRSGDAWVADVDLREFPFEHFERPVVASVTARDGARNASAPVAAAAVSVTRLRWQRLIDPEGAVLSPTAPAVTFEGTAVIGGSNGKVYFIRPDGADAQAPLSVGSGAISSAPAVGEHAIWVGSEDFSLYAVELDGSAVKANVGVDLGGSIRGSVAVQPAGSKEWVFATASTGDGTGVIGVSSSAQGEDNVTFAPAQEGFATGPIINLEGRIHAATATTSDAATLRSYVLSTSPVGLTATPWTASIGTRSSAPLSADAGGAVLSASDETPPVIYRTVPGTTPLVEEVGELSALAASSAIVLANGDVVVGDESGRMHRFSAAGPAWSPPPNLGAAVRGPMVLAGTTAPFIVPTNAGKVHALDDAGVQLWEGTLPSAVGLRAANIHTPPGQPAGTVMSLAYLASGNGRLYAVIVDGALDASAPWPKAFHDPRNTNRAGAQP